MLSVISETTTNTSAYDGALLGANITIGSTGNNAFNLNGWVGNVELGDKVNGCQ